MNTVHLIIICVTIISCAFLVCATISDKKDGDKDE